MRILMGIGDIHLQDKEFYKTGLDNFLTWFDSKIPDDKKACTEIMLTGDIFDKISLLPETSAIAIKFFNILHKKASTIYTILGNHDYGLSHYKVKNTAPFLKKLQVQVIDQSCIFTTNLGFKLLCLPWSFNNSHAKINEYIDSVSNQSFDACISHWEIDSLFGSAYINIQPIQSKVFYCGHIHSHEVQPQYLGSILPNNVLEIKEGDNSVLRLLVEKEGAYSSKDLPIPSFVQLKTIYLHSLEELDNIVLSSKNVFFKIKYNPSLNSNSIENKCKILGLQLYSIERGSGDQETIFTQQFSLNGNIEKYTPKNNKELLQQYKPVINLTEEEFSLAQKITEEINS